MVGPAGEGPEGIPHGGSWPGMTLSLFWSSWPGPNGLGWAELGGCTWLPCPHPCQAHPRAHLLLPYFLCQLSALHHFRLSLSLLLFLGDTVAVLVLCF